MMQANPIPPGTLRKIQACLEYHLTYCLYAPLPPKHAVMPGAAIGWFTRKSNSPRLPCHHFFKRAARGPSEPDNIRQHRTNLKSIDTRLPKFGIYSRYEFRRHGQTGPRMAA